MKMPRGTRLIYQDGTQYSVEFDEPVTVVTSGGTSQLDDVRLIILRDDSGERIAVRVEDFEEGDNGEAPLFAPI